MVANDTEPIACNATIPCHPYGFKLNPKSLYVINPRLPNNIINASEDTKGGDIIVQISIFLIRFLLFSFLVNVKRAIESETINVIKDDDIVTNRLFFINFKFCPVNNCL